MGSLGTLCSGGACGTWDVWDVSMAMLRECGSGRVTELLVWGMGRYGCGECGA